MAAFRLSPRTLVGGDALAPTHEGTHRAHGTLRRLDRARTIPPQARAAPAPAARAARPGGRDRRLRRRSRARVGDGALPTASLPAVRRDGRRTARSRPSRSSATSTATASATTPIGMPSADVAGSADAGIVYVFLGKPGQLPATPDGARSGDGVVPDQRPRGRDARLLGRRRRRQRRRPRRHRDRRADGRRARRRAAAAPSTSSSARRSPAASRRRRSRSPAYTNAAHESGDALAARQPLRRLPGRTRTRACRWPRCPTSTATASTTSPWARPTPSLHRPAAAASPCSTASRTGVHITLNDLWERGYPYFFHVDLPDLDDQHVGMSVASVGDMTGDGQPDIAIGAPQADPDGRTDAGSVWIISAHLPAGHAAASRRPVRRRDAARGSSSTASAAARATASTAPPRAISSARRSRASATRTATASATSRSARRARRRSGARVRARSSSSPARQRRRRATWPSTPPLQTVDGAEAGAGLGASLAAAGQRARRRPRRHARRRARAQSSAAGTAYLVPGAAGHAPTSRGASSLLASQGAGAMAGSAVAAGAVARRHRRRGRADRRARRGRRGRLVRRRRRRHAGARRLRPARRTRRSPPPVTPPRRPPPATPPATPAATPAPRGGARRATSAPAATAATTPATTATGRRHGRRREEGQEEAPALPAQEAEAEVPDRQGQAREGQAGAVPPAPEELAKARRKRRRSDRASHGRIRREHAHCMTEGA